MLKQFRATYHLTEEGHCCPKLFQHTIVCLLVLRWKRGRELVHCLYKKLQTCLPTSRRPAKSYNKHFVKSHRVSHFNCFLAQTKGPKGEGKGKEEEWKRGRERKRKGNEEVGKGERESEIGSEALADTEESQTPQSGIKPGTLSNLADALPLSHRDKRHHHLPLPFPFPLHSTFCLC